MRQITKQFGPVIANNAVDFTLGDREIHALLGENGAGKSTLSKILYGLYQPDSGEIIVHGKHVHLASPADAIAAGIGMVTQHFSLVPTFSVAENIILGLNNRLSLNRREAVDRINEIAMRYGLKVDPNAVVKNLAVGEQQRVEILKALYRNCRILILDEPTAVLTPQESDALFAEIKVLVQQGLSVVFISHKLEEVIDHCDKVTVLRDGRVVATEPVSGTSAALLARQMVGRDMATPTREPNTPGQPVVKIEGLNVKDNRGVSLLRDVNMTIHAGEIVGLAGVAGNGQRDLSEVLCGLRPVTAGRVIIDGKDLTNASIDRITKAGIGRIPEDRMESVVGLMSVAMNLALEHLDEFTRNGTLDQPKIQQNAERLIRDYQIKASPHDQARRLSGGNIQKIILARTLSRDPVFIVAAQPTRGLDVGATEYAHDRLREQRKRGAAILLISEDLDEILKLSDRVMVMHAGEIMGDLPVAEATIDRLGMLMGGVKEAVQHG
ncbi:MAG: ABC transporter ATP-binding protein [Anaerolineae bacterium]|nr:ABC transporter ATP-binding protein [Anaerolineae bacterium]